MPSSGVTSAIENDDSVYSGEREPEEERWE